MVHLKPCLKGRYRPRWSPAIERKQMCNLLFWKQRKKEPRTEPQMPHIEGSNRRQFVRLWCAMDAKLYTGGQYLCDCKVENISSAGMGLSMDSDISLPANFEIEELGEINRVSVRKVWRSDQRVGVRLSNTGSFSNNLLQ